MNHLTEQTGTTTLIEKGIFMADHLAPVSPLSRLAERWVIVLPGDALYSPDGPVRPGDPDNDWDPELFRTEDDARVQLERLAADAESIGLNSWTAQVARLGDVGAVSVPAYEHVTPDVEGLNRDYPAPAPLTHHEYAVLVGGPYREYSPDHPEPFMVFPDIEYAQDRAGDIAEDWAPRLGVAGHPVMVVSRTITVTTGPWEPAE
ncbi:hypothetical protein [Nocardia sp. NPDC059228]|uniref:hypothetical protein n=1 Tax=Nocardia sp. NPDC059228 TaxID=3346777 RepID=UPI0036B598E8